MKSKYLGRNINLDALAVEEHDNNAKIQGLSDLNHELLSIGGAYVSLDKKAVYGKQVQERGKPFYRHHVYQTVYMLQGRCHWNAAALYLTGKCDAIATGFLLCSINGKTKEPSRWIVHSWGMYNHQIIETTDYKFVQAYYGIILTKKEATKSIMQKVHKQPDKLNESLALALNINSLPVEIKNDKQLVEKIPHVRKTR